MSRGPSRRGEGGTRMFGWSRTSRVGLGRARRSAIVVAALTTSVVASVVGSVAEGVATAGAAPAYGAPTHLAWTTQPSPALVQAGQVFTVVASVEDSQGVVVANDSDTIELDFYYKTSKGAALACSGGTPSPYGGSIGWDVVANDGVATFDCSINLSGDYNFGLSDNTDTSVGGGSLSSYVGVDPGPPASVSFTTPPQNAATGVPFPVAISVLDQYGNLETGDTTDQVTLALSGGTAGASLTCTPEGATSPSQSAPIQSGAASFDCSVGTAGTGYSITASLTSGPGSGLQATSAPFAIGQESAAVVVAPDPAADVNGAGSYSVTVTLSDAAGSPLAGHEVSVGPLFSDQSEGLTGASGTGTTDANGVVTLSLQCPSISGPFLLSATDTSTATVAGGSSEACAQVAFPTEDSVGQQDSFSLTGAPADAPVGVSFAADSAASSVAAVLGGTCSTDGSGDLAYGACSYTVPALPGITPPVSVLAIVTVGGGAGEVAYDVPGFELLAPTSLLLQPGSGPPGTPVQATASGFFAGELVDFYYGSQYLSSCTSDQTGSCSVSFAAPADPGGSYTVEADGETSGAVADASFSETAAVSVSPNTGAPDSHATLTAAGFAASEVVEFTFGTSAVGHCSTDSTGGCSTGFVVPGGATGPTTVTASGETSGSTATTTFDVTGVVLSPTSGPAGTSLDAKAEGFLPHEVVDVYYNAVKQSSCTADSTGACSVTFTVPALEAHTYGVRALGETSGAAGQATFTETAALGLTPTSGPADSAFGASASGFLPGETVQFSVDGSQATSCTADGTGSCEATLGAPAAGPGSYTIRAAGATSGISASATFTELGASLSISPASGPAGTIVDASVSNFLPSETVDIYYGGSLITSCSADTNGDCATSVPVPAGPGGTYAIEALGSSSNERADASFLETPTLQANPDSGPVGSTFDALASGFAAGDVVSISYGSASDWSCTADVNGDCSALVTVPLGAAGAYSVSALGTSGLSASTTFDQTVALELSPSAGAVGSTAHASAAGFEPGEFVDIYYGGGLSSQCMAGTNGGCTASFVVPVGPVGTYSVTAIGETSGFVADATFTLVPAVTLSPATGRPFSTYQATATGFTPNEEIYFYFGSVFAGQCVATINGECLITADVPAVPSAVYEVQADQVSSGLTASAPFDAVPGLSLWPPSGTAGSTFSAVATGFAPSDTINFLYNDVVVGGCTTGSTTGCSIVITVPPGPAGSYNVLAFDGTLNASATYIQLSPGTLALTPSSGTPGAPFDAEVSGFSPTENVQITFDGQSGGSCTTDASGDCTASGTVPVNLPAGSYAVNASDAASDNASASFTIEPAVSAVPASGQPGAPFTALASGFAAGETVSFRSEERRVGTCSADASGDCTAMAFVPVAAPAGSSSVIGTGQSSGLIASTPFKVLSAAPTVTSVSPNLGRTGGGTSVTISGTNFVGGATVHFGTAKATNVQFVNGSTLTATSPPGTGSVDVTVTTPGGTSATSSADLFTYLPAPTVTGVSPASGPLAGGNTVTITGTNFANPATVTFGGVAASNVDVMSSTTITLTAPAGTAGSVNVIVTTPGGTSGAVAADRYRYL